MHLTGKSYVPTLAIRPSEMNALEFLDGTSKEKMTPVILLAPWSNAKTLNQAVERAKRAFPGQPFILDIDHNYDISSTTPTQAQQEWLNLQDGNNGYKNWYDFCNKFENIIPCLRLHNISSENLKKQIDNISIKETEFCLRITDTNHQALDTIISILKNVGISFSVIIDGEWTDDAISLAGRQERLITNYISKLDEHVIIVSSCTSMIRKFNNISGIENIPFTNHKLVQQLNKNTNRKIIYGDWGSTSPRYRSVARPPKPRIDFPTPESWVIARKENWSYQNAASEVITSRYWDNLPNELWGKQLIEQTAQGIPSISSPQKNVTARVNIHLYRQAMFNQNNIISIDNIPWMD